MPLECVFVIQPDSQLSISRPIAHLADLAPDELRHVLEQFDLFTRIFGVAGQVHRCRFDLRCRRQAALDVDLESLDEIKKFVDRCLRRDEL